MRVGIELNGVLRDTLRKIQETYVKWYLESNTSGEETKYKLISDVTTLNLREHIFFESNEELYDFLYVDFPMEIFGHSGSVEYSGLHDLNNLYLDFRENHDIIIVSGEMGKSKPASLFFLSKFGCLIESVIFYSEGRMDRLWDNVDMLVTANPKLIESHPNDKKIIRFLTNYNDHLKNVETIPKISDLSIYLI